MHGDVVVVGGGLVGLSLAYELAGLGAAVTVVDAAHRGRATDAGAGILSPATSTDEDPEWFEVLGACGRHYPELLARLAADGVDTSGAHYAVCGILSIGLRAHEDDWFAPFARLVRGRSPDAVRELTAGEAQTLFPPLGPVHRVLHHPGAARIDGRGMADALRAGAVARGVNLITDEVTGIVSGQRNRVTALTLGSGERVACGTLAVTGGAWSAAMGEWLATRLPVTPTKGQILHLGVEGDTGSWPIAQPLLTHYLVPWPSGRVACGGTFEVGAGFDTAVSAAGLHELLRECLEVAPGLGSARPIETWVGLRPTSTDDRPIVGRLGAWANAWVATGHGANGLLQGPFSARALAHQMADRSLGSDEPRLPSLVDPARFG